MDWTLIWNGISAVSALLSLGAALLIYFLAKSELKKNNEISELDIYFRIKSDINSIQAQEIYQGIVSNKLSFVRNGDNSIDFIYNRGKTVNEYLPELFEVSAFEAHFLGHLEDLAIAFEKKLISMETIKAGYCSFILNSANSPTVYNYVSYLRNEKFHDNELYSGFEQLYLKLYNELSIEQKKRYRPAFL